MQAFLRILLITLLFISCNKKDRTIYHTSELEVYDLIQIKNIKYLIFDLKTESSLNWPDSVSFKYNKDSTSVKLFVRKHSALLDENTKQVSSNILLVRNCPELNLSYQNRSDSIKKSSSYVILLPQAVNSVKFPE